MCTIYTDGGSTWTQQGIGVTTYDLMNLHFVSATTGWAIGYQMPPNTGKTILYTSDGGTNWTEQQGNVSGIASLDNLMSVYAYNANTGWILTSDDNGAVILSTADAGQTWTTTQTGLSSSIDYNSIYFATENIGFIAGNSGAIAKTEDGGATWETIATTVDGDFKKVHCPTTSVCYAGGVGGSLVKLTISAATYNASEVIQSLTMDATSDTIISSTLTSTDTLNSNISYFLSADGGANWESTTSGSTHYFTNTGSDLRWKVALSAANSQTSTPTISSLTLSYNFYPPTQQITSSWLDSETANTIWSSLAWTESLPANTDIKFQIRTAPDSDGAPGTPTDFCGPNDSNANTCSTATYFTNSAGGETIDNLMTDGSNDQWLQYKAFFILSDGASSTPTLSDVTVTYTLNSAPNAPASGFSPSSGEYIVSQTPPISWNRASGQSGTESYLVKICTDEALTLGCASYETANAGDLSLIITSTLTLQQRYYYAIKTKIYNSHTWDDILSISAVQNFVVDPSQVVDAARPSASSLINQYGSSGLQTPAANEAESETNQAIDTNQDTEILDQNEAGTEIPDKSGESEISLDIREEIAKSVSGEKEQELPESIETDNVITNPVSQDNPENNFDDNTHSTAPETDNNLVDDSIQNNDQATQNIEAENSFDYTSNLEIFTSSSSFTDEKRKSIQETIESAIVSAELSEDTDLNLNGIDDNIEKLYFKNLERPDGGIITTSVGNRLDSDNDGISDIAEIANGTNPNAYDSDRDGVDDLAEIALGLDPNKSDSDGNGVLDSLELDLKANPLLQDELSLKKQYPGEDSDGDGLSDLLELNLGLDPYNPDTDSDGFTDGEEREAGTNPKLKNQTDVQNTLKITNLTHNSRITGRELLIKGIGPKGMVVELMAQSVENDINIIKLAETLISENNKFVFVTPPDGISSGRYTLLVQEKKSNITTDLLTYDSEINTSDPIPVIVDENLNIPSPTPKKLADKVILKDIRLEIQDKLPLLYGSIDTDNQIEVIATWQSMIFSSALLLDTNIGEFYTLSPNKLEPGRHTVYLYASRISDNALSEEKKLDFEVTESGEVIYIDKKFDIWVLPAFFTILIILMTALSFIKHDRTNHFKVRRIS